jgi:hypothetical protein
MSIENLDTARFCAYNHKNINNGTSINFIKAHFTSYHERYPHAFICSCHYSFVTLRYLDLLTSHPFVLTYTEGWRFIADACRRFMYIYGRSVILYKLRAFVGVNRQLRCLYVYAPYRHHALMKCNLMPSIRHTYVCSCCRWLWTLSGTTQ